MVLTGVAYAMAGGGSGQAGSGSSPLVTLAPIVIMFVIFYFLLIRPQQKQARKHTDFIRSLKAGDRVVTSSGIHGIVRGLTDTTVTLEIADDVRIKITRGSITGSSQEAAGDAKSAKE